MNVKQTGFTLIEIAIVLLIVSILLGYTIAFFPIQQELKQYRQANAEMDEIIDALIGFAQVNGRLPCPDTGAGALVNDGLEDTLDLIDNGTGVGPNDGVVDNCVAFFGFIPSRTLGLSGDINADGVSQDPWGTGYGYAVSGVDAGGDSVIDLISPNGIREEGLPAVSTGAGRPDLFICNDSTVLANNDKDCDDVTGAPVVGNVAAVIISVGKDSDISAGASNIQQENFDDFDDGTNDKVYIAATRSDVAGAEYDDIVKWISPNKLFSKMIEADQLP